MILLTRISLVQRSILVITPKTGLDHCHCPSLSLWENCWRRRLRILLSPGPISWSAGRRKATASLSARDSSTISLSRCPRTVLGRCIPGVSTRTIWQDPVVTIARIALRVVSGFDDVIAICLPARALIRVDLPTFGRPTTAMNPDRKPSAPALSWISGMFSLPLLIAVILAAAAVLTAYAFPFNNYRGDFLAAAGLIHSCQLQPVDRGC